MVLGNPYVMGMSWGDVVALLAPVVMAVVAAVALAGDAPSPCWRSGLCSAQAAPSGSP
jgi:hypothetical protein